MMPRYAPLLMLNPDEILSFPVFLIILRLCVFACAFKDLLKTF